MMVKTGKNFKLYKKKETFLTNFETVNVIGTFIVISAGVIACGHISKDIFGLGFPSIPCYNAYGLSCTRTMWNVIHPTKLKVNHII